VDLVGPGAAQDIFYTGRRLDAEEAKSVGLVNRIAPREEFDALLAEYVTAICTGAPLTIKAGKRIIREVLKADADIDMDLCQSLIKDCFESEDYAEGRRAFMEKRKPVFKENDRNMIRTLAAALLLAATPLLAAWPEKPIKILIGYTPGGSTDVVARLIAPKLQEKLGQPWSSRTSRRGGDFAAELMLQAPADGYTLMMSTVALHAINPGMFKQKFHPIDDFTPISFVCSYPMIMIASPQSTFKTLADLRAANAKDSIFYASSGVGSPGHLSVSSSRARPECR
jgi:hypothetical protein